MYNLDLLPIAERELDDAFDWYEKQSPGLGKKLYDEVKRYLSLIETDPYYFAVRYQGDLHHAVLTKFPYLIIYWVDEISKSIIVVSIFHTSRAPKHF